MLSHHPSTVKGGRNPPSLTINLPKRGKQIEIRGCNRGSLDLWVIIVVVEALVGLLGGKHLHVSVARINLSQVITGLWAVPSAIRATTSEVGSIQ